MVSYLIVALSVCTNEAALAHVPGETGYVLLCTLVKWKVSLQTSLVRCGVKRRVWRGRAQTEFMHAYKSFHKCGLSSFSTIIHTPCLSLYLHLCSSLPNIYMYFTCSCGGIFCHLKFPITERLLRVGMCVLPMSSKAEWSRWMCVCVW